MSYSSTRRRESEIPNRAHMCATPERKALLIPTFDTHTILIAMLNQFERMLTQNKENEMDSMIRELKGHNSIFQSIVEKRKEKNGNSEIVRKFSQLGSEILKPLQTGLWDRQLRKENKNPSEIYLNEIEARIKLRKTQLEALKKKKRLQQGLDEDLRRSTREKEEKIKSIINELCSEQMKHTTLSLIESFAGRKIDIRRVEIHDSNGHDTPAFNP